MSNSISMTMRAGIYARVSTADQTCENQLLELKRYIDAQAFSGNVATLVADVNGDSWSDLVAVNSGSIFVKPAIPSLVTPQLRLRHRGLRKDSPAAARRSRPTSMGTRRPTWSRGTTARLT